MSWIEPIVKAFLEWLTSLARQDTSSIDAKRDPQLADQLRARLPDDGMRNDKSGLRPGG